MDILRAVAILLLAFSIDVGICAIALASEIDLGIALWVVLASNVVLLVIIIGNARRGEQCKRECW